MPSKAWYVSELMMEAGKTAPDVAGRIESKVGEVTVDLLSQNGSRFKALEKNTTLTINTTDTAYQLPADFRTARATFIEVNSTGEFVRELEIVDEREFYRRKTEERFTEDRLCFIEWRTGATGRFAYLVLGSAPADTKYYKFYYWREPHTDDTDAVNNPAIVKKGVRGALPDLFPITAGVDAAAYQKMKEYFREDVVRTTTGNLQLKPNRVVQRHNRLMHKIGRGG